MLGKAVRTLLRDPVGIAAAVVTDPLETWIAFRERLAEYRKGGAPPGLYYSDPNWERRLHELLGVTFPCSAIAEFWTLYPRRFNEKGQFGIIVKRGAVN